MARLNKIIEELSKLTVVEAADLSKQLEEKWGVKAITPVAATPASDKDAAPAEEKTEFTIFLVSAGDKKINVIKEVRAITGLGLKEAKDLVEAAPKEVKKGVSKKLEKKWGVTAATAVAAAPAASAAAPAEEKTDFTIFLAAIGDKKINVIKEVRAITGLGLKEAKDLVEAAPKEVKKNVPKKDAEDAKKKLEAAGAKIELK